MRRLLPILCLTACYDSATTTITLDLKAGTAHVEQQLHNAWPDEVGCDVDGPAAECVEHVRAKLDEAKAKLQGDGATVTSAGVVLNQGALDLRYVYDAPVGAEALSGDGLKFLWLEDRSPRQVKAGKPGKKRLALISADGNGTRVDARGRYRQLTGQIDDDAVGIWMFRGSHATVVSEWTYTPGADDPKSPGPWLSQVPGLEDALRGSGLVL